jgi:type IV secretory pathway TrbD component
MAASLEPYESPYRPGEVPIHRALTQVILIAGAPRAFTILNSTVTAAMVLGAHVLWYVPVGVVLHGIGVLGSQRDPHFFEVLLRHLKATGYWAP